MKIITLQPSPRTDFLTDDGTELTRKPYPFHVRENGAIEGQDFWQGRPLRVLGFAERLDREQVDLWWGDAVRDPQRAVGMYVITQDIVGGIAMHLTAIEKVTIREDAP